MFGLCHSHESLCDIMTEWQELQIPPSSPQESGKSLGPDKSKALPVHAFTGSDTVFAYASRVSKHSDRPA